MTKCFNAVVPDAYRDIYAHYQYAPAVRVGDDIHVSGIVGVNADFSIPEDYEAQLANIFDLLEGILAEAGATLADVHSLVSYHVGDLPAQMPGFIQAKTQRLGEPHPSWTAVGVTQLAVPGAMIEVSAQARLRG